MGSDEEKWTVKSLLSFFFLAHLGRGFDKEPLRISGMKIAFYTVSFTGFMIFTMYTSYLSASLIVKKVGPPIKNIEEITEFPNKLAMSDGGSIHKMFLNAKNGSTYEKILTSGKIQTSKRDTLWIQNAMKGKFWTTKSVIYGISSWSVCRLKRSPK